MMKNKIFMVTFTSLIKENVIVTENPESDDQMRAARPDSVKTTYERVGSRILCQEVECPHDTRSQVEGERNNILSLISQFREQHQTGIELGIDFLEEVNVPLVFRFKPSVKEGGMSCEYDIEPDNSLETYMISLFGEDAHYYERERKSMFLFTVHSGIRGNYVTQVATITDAYVDNDYYNLRKLYEGTETLPALQLAEECCEEMEMRIDSRYSHF